MDGVNERPRTRGSDSRDAVDPAWIFDSCTTAPRGRFSATNATKALTLGLALLGRLLEVVAAEFLGELLDAARRVDVSLLTREEGVTIRADFDLDLRLCGSRRETITATTAHRAFNVVGMYILFHVCTWISRPRLNRKRWISGPFAFNASRSQSRESISIPRPTPDAILTVQPCSADSGLAVPEKELFSMNDRNLFTAMCLHTPTTRPQLGSTVAGGFRVSRLEPRDRAHSLRDGR